MATAYQMDEDDVDVNEPVVMDDLSDQETSDVLEPAKKVVFEIKKAEVRKQYEDPKDKTSTWMVTRLNLQAKVGENGTDGEGKYAGRVLFPEFIIAFNKEEKKGEWWEKKARGPAKELFLALGFDLKAMPAIDADFLSSLEGRFFMADILQRKVQEKTDQVNDKGKAIYKDTGEYRNELANIRAAD